MDLIRKRLDGMKRGGKVGGMKMLRPGKFRMKRPRKLRAGKMSRY